KKRVYTVNHLPNASGRSRHGEPVRAIQRTASIKSRLSRPLEPGSPTLPDSSGAIRSHWASLNMNRIKADLHFSALNQFSTDLGILSVNRPYSVRRNERGFWEPRPHMRALGFYCVPCGQDGPDAWAIAEEWNRRWQAVKRGEAPSPAMAAAENLSPEQSEELTVYPPRSLGEAFKRYRHTEEWTGK